MALPRDSQLTMPDLFSQPGSARTEIYEQLASFRLVDPHTHINPHSPASSTLADLLGYHYYTELAHSAGMPKTEIEQDGIRPKELVERLVGGLEPLENTVQYSWLMSICRTFFGFDEDRLHLNNWEALYDRSEAIMNSAQWPDMVLDQSNVEAVFLTNDFDDDLQGFDSDRYIPCLRTDDLVFHLGNPDVRGRLEACTGVALDGSLSSLRAALTQRFEHFVANGARACAISLPPTFAPEPVQDGRASTALDAILREGLSAAPSQHDAIARRVFWTLAELCDDFGLPFDLMIGVNRKVYPDGVFQGQDLFDSRVSLIQYRALFNAFPKVKFPVSVLASVTNQELLSYAWIFPNVYPNGHWWYSNTPSTIHHDLSARLEAVPQTKLIGYYSDAYKLEFVWPKFDMYRKVLSNVLAEQFVENRGWSIDRVVELGQRILKDNVSEIFPRPQVTRDDVSPIAADALPMEDDDLGSVTLGDIDIAAQEEEPTAQTAGPENDDGIGLGDMAKAGAAGLAATAGLTGLSDLADADAPELDMPELDMPELDLPELETQEVTTSAVPVTEADAADEDAPPDNPADVDTTEWQVPEIDQVASQTADQKITEEETTEPEIEELVIDESDSTAPDLTDTELPELTLPEPVGDSPDTAEAGVPSLDAVASELELPNNDVLKMGTDELEVEIESPENALPAIEVPEIMASEEDALETSESGEEVASSAEDEFDPNIEFETVVMESMDGAKEKLDLDDSLELEAPADEKDRSEVESRSIDDFGTVVEEPEARTVLIEPEPVDSSEQSDDQELPRDPLPDDDEVGELDLDDVELIDPAGNASLQTNDIGAELDDEPLDVGDLLSADDDDEPKPTIQPLRGETSFSPDDERLQLKSDPTTGEFRMEVDSSESDDDEFDLDWLNEDNEK